MNKLFKLLGMILLFAVIAIVVYGMADYWLGLATFPFVSTVAVAAFHLIVLVVLAMAVYHFYHYKG